MSDLPPAAGLISGSTPLAGELVGRFEIERLIGRGGFGDVFLARDPDLGRRVALKLLRPDRFGSPEAVEGFLDEARTTARFTHPHIVAVYEVGSWRGRPWVALEYLEGQDLRSRMDEGRLGILEVVRVGLAVASALAEAHRGGILHRDLKPGNVMIPRDGRVRVVDFGEARRLAQADGELCGTPGYLAPERWRGEAASPAVDIWALGVVLYECLCGARPYQHLPARTLALRVGGPDPIPALPGGERLPPQLVQLVARCLDKDPLRRPSADEVAEALQGILAAGTAELGPRVGEQAGPYRGLLPYSARDAGRFFGRDQEIGAFLEHLRGAPTVLVTGPSGAGKTSFLHAGVIPRLGEQGPWIVVTARPGRAPFLALAAALDEATAGESGATDGGVAASAAALTASPGRLRRELRALADEVDARVLLVLDQLEELFTHGGGEAELRAFLRAISAVADTPGGPVRVVLSLRDDFLGRLATVEEARPAIASLFVLRPPGPAALCEIVQRPLADLGYRLEDEGQARAMVDQVVDTPGCLPVLQAACGQLWDARDPTRRLIPAAALARIGGVSGALARHADLAVDGLPPGREAQARILLLRLVTPEGTRRVVPRSELLQGAGAGAGALLDRLLRGRVVQARPARGAAGEGDIELTHDSLVTGWDRLRRWLDEARDQLAWLDDLGQAAHGWTRRGELDEELWSGAALSDALASLARLATPAPAPVVRFLERAREVEHGRQRRRRRGRLIQAGVAGASVLLAVLVVAPMHARRSTDRICGHAAERLEGTWGDVERERLLAWSSASERPHAAHTVAQVSRLLDDYAAEWVSMREDACLATYARGEQSAELYDRRMWCLDRRLGELRSLTEVLAGEVDEPVMDELVSATWELTPLVVCADVEALSSAVPPPETPALRSSLDALRPDLDDAVTRFRLGDYDRARHGAAEVADRSAELGYTPFEAEAAYWLGQAAAETGEAADAEEQLLRAIELASAARDDHLAAEGWVALMGVVGDLQGRYRDALLLGRLAGAQVDRAGNEPFQRVRLLAVLGRVQAEMDLFDDAQASFDEAYRILQEQLGTAHPEVAGILEGTGWLAIGQADYDRAEELFQRALEVRVSALGPDHPKLALSLEGVVKARFRAGRYEQAREAAERALELRRAALGPEHPSVGVSIGALGPIDRAEGDFEGALERYEQALVILEGSERANPSDLATVLNNTGALYGHQRKVREAREYYERALAVITEAYGADHTRAARVLDNLGTTYQWEEGEGRSHWYAEQALAIRERAFGPEHYDVARSLFYMAIYHTNEGDYVEALALFDRCVPVMEARLGDHRMNGYVLSAYGEALVGAERPGEAIPVLEHTLAMRERLGEVPLEIAETRFQLARALAATDGDPARIDLLAEQAREVFAGADGAASSLAKLERWLATR